MTSTRAIGRRYEKICEKKLQECGWNTYLVPMKQRFTTQCDVWELFDIIAYKGLEVLCIQVKLNSTRGFVKRLEEWCKEHQNPYLLVQLWVWEKEKRGWKIYNIQSETVNGMKASP